MLLMTEWDVLREVNLSHHLSQDLLLKVCINYHHRQSISHSNQVLENISSVATNGRIVKSTFLGQWLRSTQQEILQAKTWARIVPTWIHMHHVQRWRQQFWTLLMASKSSYQTLTSRLRVWWNISMLLIRWPLYPYIGKLNEKTKISTSYEKCWWSSILIYSYQLYLSITHKVK